jgi:hypothetical protein
LGNALSEVLLGDEDGGPPVIELAAPTPGLTAHLEWGSPPLDRRCVLSQGLGQSWGIAPIQLSGPVSILFKVNREGKVTLVHEQPDDGQGFIEAMTKALLGYRFEPVASSAPPSQYGTVIIRPEQGRPR